VEQLIEYKSDESINQYTRKGMVTPIRALEEAKRRVFEHSEVVAKDERSLEKRKAKKNHAKVEWEEKNVKNSFIIKEWITGHLARIQIDSGSDLDCILERFVKRHNLPTIKHSDSIRIKRFNEEIAGAVEKQTEVSVRLGEVEVGRIRLDLVMTDMDAILGVKWLRRNRPQFGWENNTLK
jgi:Retroviral aspartyl protease